MKAESIRRQLREFKVPADRIAWAVERYASDEPEPTPPALRMIEREAKRIRAETERKKFRLWCKSKDIPFPDFEFRFHPVRQWRADIAWPDPDGGGVLLEIDGGGHKRGRHHRPEGFAADQAKRNEAQRLGYKTLHCTPQTLYTDTIAATLRELLAPK